MSVKQLKEAVESVAKQAKNLDQTLTRFKSTNRKQMASVKKALEDTSTGADQKVASALQAAEKAISDASKALQGAAQAADRYKNSL